MFDKFNMNRRAIRDEYGRVGQRIRELAYDNLKSGSRKYRADYSQPEPAAMHGNHQTPMANAYICTIGIHNETRWASFRASIYRHRPMYVLETEATRYLGFKHSSQCRSNDLSNMTCTSAKDPARTAMGHTLGTTFGQRSKHVLWPLQ